MLVLFQGFSSDVVIFRRARLPVRSLESNLVRTTYRLEVPVFICSHRRRDDILYLRVPWKSTNNDNVATEACFNKVAVDSTPQPVPGAANEYTAKYNVVVEAPDAPGFDTNDVIYGSLMIFGVSFLLSSKGPAPWYARGWLVLLNSSLKITVAPVTVAAPTNFGVSVSIKPKGVNGSTGQHVYEVTVRFKLDRSKLDSTSVPAGYPSQPAGNTRCYTKDGLHEPNFGLMNEAEMGGWKVTS
jgi:hypothetical protein